MLCLPPKAAFLTEDFHKSHPPLLFSVVSSSSPLILQWVFLVSTEGRDVLPSLGQTKLRQFHAVNNSPLAGFGILLVSVCLCVSQCMCMCVCGWGGGILLSL